MPKTARTRGPALQGQLEITLGHVGDGCDILFVARQRVHELGKLIDQAYQAGALGYRGVLVAKDGQVDDVSALPPRERHALAQVA